MTDKWQTTVYTDFAADFMTDRLANLCDSDAGVQTGPFGSQLHQKDYVAIGTPIITVEHLGENRIQHEDVPCVSDKDRERLAKYKLRKGDIVFSRVGSVDRRALVREKEDGWLFSGRCLRVRPDQAKIDSIYLSYFFGLPAFKEHIRSIAVGATMPSLNTYLLSTVPIYYPPLSEQRAIASILGALDDKIALNRQINHSLEAMTQAIFKSWFVDFDPVNAKAEGRKPYGMTDAVATLFPSHFEESEIGPIPEGWRSQPFSQIVDIHSGGTPKTNIPDYWDGDVPWFSVVDTPAASDIFVIDTQKRITHRGLAESAAKLLPVGTTIITARGTVGNIAIAATPLTINQSCYGLTGKDHYGQYFVYYATREIIGELRQRAHGSVFDTIVRDTFDGVACITPPFALTEAYNEIVSPLLQKIQNNVRESQTLSTIRDTLLPKLLSGEIRVKQAEKLVEQVI
jgi:type I restriction enzyme S subunit